MSPFKHQRQAFLDRNLSRFSLESAIGILKSFARVLYRLPRVFLMSIVRAYRFALSPDHSFWAKALDRPPYCRHFPSCSSYGLESLEKHGAIMGSFYAIRRILSCNPWSK
jgi:putative membrane protein insertion efficiency factor